MTDWFFLVAGMIALTWLLVHLFIGGREIARPLLSATVLDPVVRHTQYLCWHFTTVGIGCIAGFFIWSVQSGEMAFATAATALSLGFFTVGVGIVMLMKESHAKLPQGWLFLPVAALGMLGHLT